MTDEVVSQQQVKWARNDAPFVTLSDSEGSEGDSSVASLPQNDKRWSGLAMTLNKGATMTERLPGYLL